MTERDFYYWLQGWLELSNCTEVDAAQQACIERHIKLAQHDTSANLDMVGFLTQKRELGLLREWVAAKFVHIDAQSKTPNPAVSQAIHSVKLQSSYGYEEPKMRC